MKRWTQRLLAMILAVSGLIGCKQRLFITEPDLEHYKMMGAGLSAPQNLDTSIAATAQPGTWNWPPPLTVDNTNRQIRYLSLPEAISIALESGTTGSQSLQFPGVVNENLPNATSDAIRVFALDPAVAGSQIEAALARFDVLWASSVSWSKQDEATVNTFATNGDNASFNTGLYKALPAGGVIGITFSTDYQKFDLNTTNANFIRFNTSYKPRLKLSFEQPLLQGYGVELNQLSSVHSGSAGIVSINQASGLANRVQPSGEGRQGILVARVRYDQSKAEFERNLNFMLLNVEYAYWNLYAAYGSLFARDKAVVEAYDLWKTIENRTKAGLALPPDQWRVRAQFEAFRAQRYQSLGDVLEKERQLRGLLGIPDDATRLVPIDKPSRAPYQPNWQEGIADALTNRPELVLSRQDLKLRQFDILVNKNLLKPDLRLFANYDVNGIGERLDGSETFTTVDQFGQPVTNPHNALASFTNNKFNNWQFGLRFDVPLGFRDAHAAMRISRLNLLRSYASLQKNELKVISQLQNQYSRMVEHYRTMNAQYAQFEAAREQYKILKNRQDLQDLPSTLEAMLTAQRTMADAKSSEYKAEADYNSTLAGWQAAKGTIMQYDSVNVANGALPECAQIRATDHFRERTKALVLRERAENETGAAGILAIEQDPLSEVLPLPRESPKSVPEMMRGVPRPNVPAVPQNLDPRFAPQPQDSSAAGRLPQPPWTGNGVVPAGGPVYTPSGALYPGNR